MSIRTPAALIDGVWLESEGGEAWEHRNPAEAGETLATVTIADQATVRRVVESAAGCQDAWGQRPVAARLARLTEWRAQLEGRRAECVALLALEVGKPRRDAEEEFSRTLAHLESVARLAADRLEAVRPGGPLFRIRHRPVGTVLAITPWNNPLAIPVSKMAAALAYGNAVVWKPAVEASRLSMLAMDCLLAADGEAPPVAVAFGGASTAGLLLDEPRIDAVTFTGSSRVGSDLIGHCGRMARPCQAEMGGNNAAIVMSGARLDEVVEGLMGACFSFSGQRCTAIRRLILEESIREEFEGRFLEAVSRLRLGLPAEPDTAIGPLISTEHRDRVLDLLRRESESGSCEVLRGGEVPPEFAAGAWLEPTVVGGVQADSPLVREELFAPVVTLQSCAGIEEAIALANGVDHGLTAVLYSPEGAHAERFLREAAAGMLRVNPADFALPADAPFTGWKHSGFGPPEHGICDADFFTRVQVVYT